MSAAGHILRKDARRFAGWLVVFVAVCVVVAARDVLLAQMAATKDLEASRMFAAMGGIALVWLSPFVRALLSAQIVAMVVHEDPLVDARAFWLTRPIGGRRLFVAKLLFVVAFVLLPCVGSDVASLAVNGGSARQIATVVPEIMLLWSWWVAGLFLLSSLAVSTRGVIVAFGRFLVIAGAVLAVFMLPLLADHPMVEPYRRWILQSNMVWGRSVSQLIVAIGLATTFATAITAVQYATRRTRLGWSLIAASVAALIVVATGWRWDFVGRSGATAAVPTRRITARVESVTLTPSKSGGYDTAMRVDVQGVEAPLVGEIEQIWGTFRPMQGESLMLTGPWTTGRTWNAAGIAPLFDGARIANRAAEDGYEVRVTTVPSEDVTPGTTGRLWLRARVGLHAYRIAARLPLAVDASDTSGGTRRTVLAVQCEDHHCAVEVDEVRVHRYLTPDSGWITRTLIGRPESSALHVLHNRARGEVLWPRSEDVDPFGWPSIRRIEHVTSKLAFHTIPGADGARPRIDDAWIAGAEIVAVEAELRDVVERRIDQDPFTLDVRLPVRP